MTIEKTWILLAMEFVSFLLLVQWPFKLLLFKWIFSEFREFGTSCLSGIIYLVRICKIIYVTLFENTSSAKEKPRKKIKVKTIEWRAVLASINSSYFETVWPCGLLVSFKYVRAIFVGVLSGIILLFGSMDLSGSLHILCSFVSFRTM